MATYRLDFGYDGAGFHGYAKQAGVRTIQEVLEKALFKLTGPVATTVAGRTDAGVHARGQVVSFTVDGELEEARVVRSLNKLLSDEIVVHGCCRAVDAFNARLAAVSRTYRYQVLARPFPDPLLRHVVWHVSDPLDRGSMQEAARYFVGERDFASLCRRAEGRSTVRRVLSAEWSDAGDGLFVYRVTATSFCHQMVRSMVALSVEVGRGAMRAEEVPAILDARDRNRARGVAPPQGLTLWEVAY